VIHNSVYIHYLHTGNISAAPVSVSAYGTMWLLVVLLYMIQLL
jgi:hypothetical protein